MIVRDATKTPPFVLEDKRAIVKSHDHRGREQLGFGEASDVWTNFALAPLAGGLTDSIDIRFVGGAFWYRVTISQAEALALLEQDPKTEELRQVIASRYSLEASPAPKSRLRCQFSTTSRRCDREAEPGWTTCKAHYDKGGPREAAGVEDDEVEVFDVREYEVTPEGQLTPIDDSPKEEEPEEPPMQESEEEDINTDIAAQRDELLRRVWELEHEIKRLRKDDVNEEEHSE